MAQVFKRFVKVANFHPNSVTLDDKEQTKFYLPIDVLRKMMTAWDKLSSFRK